MFKEFKEFALKGNVLDLALAVVIGGAFSKIVTSLVNDLIMPILGIIIGGINFTSLKYDIPSSISGGVDVSIKYGLFIQSVINFLIIAFSLFIFIKVIQSVQKKKAEKIILKGPSNEEILLREIRDLLKQK
ncbi:large-conductance mechanosensitive channel protein MscL [Clostridium estertheticum]|uniref:large-conductance mechanosensitive channel protein MscL n=1 Tax=Clostridium estertheticum TaxID=238834 RepID=UPI001C0B1918|nr:large-conductance mechanosensitive channel protein MscL [Clostridium estertheticum]MBU3214363.1 large-conductance mechanosensitive channel protein MscL [Clostridium estertheticum]MBW9151695.1 large-conductance mechanosensitive channel protein MscL [Clostridium estertheticum]WAG56348.1 large-conductance mechanosensitive channel protein MscL [Clostridium estertheticum]WLC83182.1 large-conductance mechanosensitive channel protein MscL [Clostridium estertheticum]